jgi:hypothetical protein
MKLSPKLSALTPAALRKFAGQVPQRYVRVATVLVIALATGHVMQHGNAIAARLDRADPVPEAPLPARLAGAGTALAPVVDVALLAAPDLPATPDVAVTRAAFDLPAVPETPLPMPAPGDSRIASLDIANDAAPEPAPMPAPAPAADRADACAPSLSLSPAPAAMIALSFAAPCAPGAEVVIEQAGLRFKVLADAEGRVALDVPALAMSAHIAVSTAAVQREADIEMPTLADYDRVALAWSGAEGPELHAFEFGADYGDAGHVWRGNPRDASWAIRARGGFEQALGDGNAVVPARLEVYTFPAGHYPGEGDVRLSLETEVTAANCNRDIAARSLTITGGVAQAPTDVTLAMPECDAQGDFLVFGTLFPEITFAAK